MVFVDWSSLPADLIDRVAECFLATSDLDQYMDFRAVCGSWRSATDDPKNSSAPRFRPRHWHSSHLFVNTTTGRFLRKELPLLHHYRILRVTADGLLVLLAIESRRISVLNPFTGYLIRFIAPLTDFDMIESAALVSGSSPSIVLLCKNMYDNDDEDGNDGCEERESSPRVYMADINSESFIMYKDGCNRAIFLGYRQCLSVNADKFPTVEANCIYYVKRIDSRDVIYKYDLKNGKEEMISGAINTINRVFLTDADPPFTIIQLLASYTFHAWSSELETEKSFEDVPDGIPNEENSGFSAIS